jgi:hypothetical protein
MILSPTLTVIALGTRSKTSDPRPWPVETMPKASCELRSTAETKLVESVRSVTRDSREKTAVTSPTRPAAVTTGSCTLIPLFEPAAIPTCW